MMLREHFDNLFLGSFRQKEMEKCCFIYMYGTSGMVPVPGYPGNSPIDNIKNVHSINGRYHCLNSTVINRSVLREQYRRQRRNVSFFRHGCRNIVFNGQTKSCAILFLCPSR